MPSRTRGALTRSDLRLDDGSVADDYRVSLAAGETVTAVARGGASATDPARRLDVYVILYDGFSELAHDDDSAGDLNARLTFTAPHAGSYTLRVTTFGPGFQSGSYELDISAGDAAPTR